MCSLLPSIVFEWWQRVPPWKIYPCPELGPAFSEPFILPGYRNPTATLEIAADITWVHNNGIRCFFAQGQGAFWVMVDLMGNLVNSRELMYTVCNSFFPVVIKAVMNSANARDNALKWFWHQLQQRREGCTMYELLEICQNYTKMPTLRLQQSHFMLHFIDLEALTGQQQD